MNLLQQLTSTMREVDREIRAASPKCPECGRPDGGFVPAGHNAWEVGLVDRKRCPSASCPMRSSSDAAR
jgi:hypothetical protein